MAVLYALLKSIKTIQYLSFELFLGKLFILEINNFKFKWVPHPGTKPV